MDNASNSSDEQGKQPASSLMNVFSSFFTRVQSPSSDMEPAVLTSFKELPDGESHLAENDQATNSDKRQTVESLETCKDSGKQAKASAGASVDQDLVQVTMVVTYSDTEDEEASQSSTSLSEKFAQAREPILPQGDNNTVDCSDSSELQHDTGAETEYKVPVFRTHKFTERSRIEAILYSGRFVSRTSSKTVLISPVSRRGHDSTTKESTTKVSLDAETLDAGENNSKHVDENDEYAGIDCSQPVTSIISGLGHNVVTALDSTPKEETQEQKDKVDKGDKGSEKHHSRHESLPSSVPASPKTNEVPVQSSSSPEEQSKSADITGSVSEKPMLQSSAPEKPLGDIQLSASPSSQCTSAPKTPETNTPSSVSSSSASSSPSKGSSLSSPPSFQMPALFSGLRVLKKGAVGEDRETLSEIKQSEKDADLALLSLKKTVNKAKLFPEQRTATPVKKQPIAETKSTVIGQLSHLLNLENEQDEKNKSDDGQDADPQHSKKESECENGEEVTGEKSPGPETPTSTPERKKASDLAYETFRNLFGPKTVKRTEEVDLESVKKKIKNDKESLRSIFERTSKSPSKDLKSPTEPNVCNQVTLRQCTHIYFVHSEPEYLCFYINYSIVVLVVVVSSHSQRSHPQQTVRTGLQGVCRLCGPHPNLRMRKRRWGSSTLRLVRT